MASREEKALTPTSTAGSWIKQGPDRAGPLRSAVAAKAYSPSLRGIWHGESRAGFTLVEIVVVMLLISMFMVFSIPVFSNIGTGSLDTSARRLSGTIKYLYNEAALSGLEYRLIYNLDEGTYRAQILEADGQLVDAADQGRQAALKGGVRFEDVQLPSRGKFSMGQVTARIDPSGWIDETIIHLDDGSGDKLTLRVMPLTGTTEIYSGYREF
jgi:prepilin-type N-terminal cleavage/methylation domain-containing protein